MIYEIDKYTDFLLKTGMTPNQFYICWLLYTKDLRNQKEYVKGEGFDPEDFKILIDKGWLIHTNPKAIAYNMMDIYVTPEFAEQIIIEPEEAWDELFEAYPAFLLIEEKKVPAKTLTYSDTKGVEEHYAKLLKKNKFLHARIIAAINVWKDNNEGYATIKIDKFIMGKHWEDIERIDDSRTKPRIY